MMLARAGMIGLMDFANKIRCESHQLERPRPRAHALPLPLAFQTCSITVCHRETFLDTLVDASEVRNDASEGRNDWINGFC